MVNITTIIKARTKNQLLTIAERPLIASGDSNTVLVHFEFDPTWSAFPVKYACFNKANTPHLVYKIKLSDDGYATVPHEVLDEAGDIFFGVKGYIPDHPEVVKTSLNIKYNIMLGVSPRSSAPPTPDEFAQMMQEVERTKQELSEEVEALDAALKEAEANCAEIISKNEKRIANLEQGLMADAFVTDSADAYTKQIPTTALPWAELQELGGTTTPDGQSAPVTSLEIDGTNRLDISGMLNECLRDNGDGTYTLTKVSDNGRFTATVPLFAPVGQQLYNTFEILDTNISNFGNKIPLQMLDASGKTEVSSVGIVDGDGGWYTAGGGSVLVRSYLEASYPIGSYITFRNPMVQFAEYYKAPIAPYAPYRKYTINIPAEVQALEGYGQGNPTGTEYNYIDFVRRVFVQKGYRDASGSWIPTGREIDISAYLPADNLIEVEGNGSITFVNAYQLPVPTKIIYQLKGVS